MFWVLGLDLLVLLLRMPLFTHISIGFVDLLLKRYSNSPWFLCLIKYLSSLAWVAFVEYSVRFPCSCSSHIASWKRHTLYESSFLTTDPWVACHSCILSVSHAYRIDLLEYLDVDLYQLAGWKWDYVSTRVAVVNFRHSVQNRCIFAVPELMKHCPFVLQRRSYIRVRLR